MSIFHGMYLRWNLGVGEKSRARILLSVLRILAKFTIAIDIGKIVMIFN